MSSSALYTPCELFRLPSSPSRYSSVRLQLCIASDSNFDFKGISLKVPLVGFPFFCSCPSLTFHFINSQTSVSFDCCSRIRNLQATTSSFVNNRQQCCPAGSEEKQTISATVRPPPLSAQVFRSQIHLPKVFTAFLHSGFTLRFSSGNEPWRGFAASFPALNGVWFDKHVHLTWLPTWDLRS